MTREGGERKERDREKERKQGRRLRSGIPTQGAILLSHGEKVREAAENSGVYSKIYSKINSKTGGFNQSKI